MDALQTISKILGIDPQNLQIGDLTVLEKIEKERQEKIDQSLKFLGLDNQSSPDVLLQALLSKMENDNQALSDFLNNPDLNTSAGRQFIIRFVSQIKSPPSGFFLKESKARQLLIANPPQKIISFLGHKTIEETLAKEDLTQIFCALRFIEDPEWLNSVFFKKYNSLTPDDFETRPLKLIVLDEHWKSSAQKFVSHKRHNISHLKELGVIFVLPLAANLPGEIMRTIGLLLHYLEEVPFYSSIIKDISQQPENFSTNLTSLLRGDVYDQRPTEKNTWLVIQRYLEKDNPQDWRLFWPHINTESLLYSRAYKNISTIGKIAPVLSEDMEFWSSLDWVAQIFDSQIISFDFMDVAMSLVDKDKKASYFYHQHEALWNKIFSSLFSEEELSTQARKNLLQGFFISPPNSFPTIVGT